MGGEQNANSHLFERRGPVEITYEAFLVVVNHLALALDVEAGVFPKQVAVAVVSLSEELGIRAKGHLCVVLESAEAFASSAARKPEQQRRLHFKWGGGAGRDELRRKAQFLSTVSLSRLLGEFLKGSGVGKRSSIPKTR